MNFPALHKQQYFDFAVVAALSVICGWLWWLTPLGERWQRASYDYLFRFGARTQTDQVTLILMDTPSYNGLKQARGQPWDRGLHAELLNRLADDGCRLVVFDAFFRAPREPETDAALAQAMQRQRKVIVMAAQEQVSDPQFVQVKPALPAEMFLAAAGTNWGVAWLDPDLDNVVRRLWPFPSPGPYASLPWRVATALGAELSSKPEQRWLRYYGQDGPGEVMSYERASVQRANYFRDRVVFIGTAPETTLLDGEADEFATPYTRWTGESSAGVKLMATASLNLLHGEWLRRWPASVECGVLLAAGILLGGLARMKPILASIAAVTGFFVVGGGAISWSYFTNDWFPWLIIAGAQLPVAWVSALSLKVWRSFQANARNLPGARKMPATPGYELFHPPLGEGAYGVVWLARKHTGEWCALKAVYQEKFGHDAAPFEREFDGVTRYQPISGRFPELLRVDFVSQRRDGCFYYVMELGDSLAGGWEREPTRFRPHNLAAERARHENRRLPVGDCLRIGSQLAAALELFHQHGLIHRDIKPENVIFVNGLPKFADFGLIADLRPTELVKTFIGTAGYMPPAPEVPGTRTADIYALGMVLYVLSSGSSPEVFPALATALVANDGMHEFHPLNQIITKACQPEAKDRFASAQELHAALQKLWESRNLDG